MLRAFILTALLLCVAKQSHAHAGDSVAIVGAGFSGLSAAFFLMEAGYTNITIYEATDRVGGYITSVDHNDVHHDMATYAITATYWKFQAAMESMGAEFCDLAVNVINNNFTPSLSFPFEILLVRLGLKTLDDKRNALTAFSNQLATYTAEWRKQMGIPYKSIFDLRTDRLFPKDPPSAKNLELLAMPMVDWIKKFKLFFLEPFFAEATDSQAYGPIETTPALYYLTWFPPLLFRRSSGAGLVPCGPHPSMQALADLLYANISGSVTLHLSSAVSAVTKGTGGSKPTVTEDTGAVVQYDNVIVTTKLPRDGLREPVVTNPSEMETAAADTMEELQIFSGLMEANRDEAVKTKGYLMINREAMTMPSPNTSFWGALNAEMRAGPGVKNPYLDTPTTTRVNAVYYYKERSEDKIVQASNSEQIAAVQGNFAEWDDAEWTPVQSRFFDGYFQRWRKDEVKESMPWAIAGVQGQGGVYYVNPAACGFESVGHVFDCADHLIQEYFE